MNLAITKLIFYSLLCLDQHENVEVITNSPKRCETIVDTKKLKLYVKSSYYNIFENGSGYDLIFRNKAAHRGGSTCFYNTQQKQIINVLEDKFALNHNLCVIKSKDNSGYFGIGGLHKPPMRTLRKYRKARHQHHKMRHSHEFIQYNGHKVVSPYAKSEQHINGLYLMKSEDMMSWSHVFDLPSISGIHPGHTDNHFKYSRFDSKISCLYSNILEKYVLYVRANMGAGRRWVQRTTSKDLTEWEPFELLSMKGVDYENDNYYHFDVIEYPGTNLFAALSAYTNKPRYPTKTCIKLMFSKDGLNWIDTGSILETPTSACSFRNSTLTTSVFFDRGDHYDLFFHENYDGVLDHTQAAKVVRYEIPKDRLVGIKANGIGRFSFKMKPSSASLVWNYECKNQGCLRVTFGSETFLLEGNELNRTIEIPSEYQEKEINIHVEMENGTLYSIST